MPRGFLAILPDQKMIMIWHETIGNDADLLGLAVFFDLRYREEIIRCLAENGHLPSAAVVDVIVHSFLPSECIFAGVRHVKTFR